MKSFLFLKWGWSVTAWYKGLRHTIGTASQQSNEVMVTRRGRPRLNMGSKKACSPSPRMTRLNGQTSNAESSHASIGMNHMSDMSAATGVWRKTKPCREWKSRAKKHCENKWKSGAMSRMTFKSAHGALKPCAVGDHHGVADVAETSSWNGKDRSFFCALKVSLVTTSLFFARMQSTLTGW